MKVLVAASECTPVVKVGGLGDVVGSLPKALKKLGIDVRVVIPAYSDVLKALSPHVKTEGTSFVTHYAEAPQKIVLHKSTLPGTDIPLYLIENDNYLSNGGVYMDPSAFASSQDEIERFAFFSKAVVETFVTRGDIFYPDIVHCNDWHTGIVPQLIKAEAKYLEVGRPATVFTIHNLANQGIGNLATAVRLDVPSFFSSEFVKWDLRDDNLDFVLQGILGSDVINTVSPSYAQEIKTAEFGEGLHEVLRAREGRLFGILNGIDLFLFNPEKDPYVKEKFPLDNVSGVMKAKGINKSLLRKELNLMEKDAPLIGFVSRLTNQKGVDLFISSVDKLIEIGFQVVMVGTGDPVLEALVKSKGSSFAGDFFAEIAFNEKLAKQVYASADFFAVPSRFEPCGLTQMIAMRYGSVPVVRGVGGLRDTVEEGRTGFMFNEFVLAEFLSAVKRAKQAYLDKRVWGQLVENCIHADFSWDKSAREYLILYGKALTLSSPKSF